MSFKTPQTTSATTTNTTITPQVNQTTVTLSQLQRGQSTIIASNDQFTSLKLLQMAPLSQDKMPPIVKVIPYEEPKITAIAVQPVKHESFWYNKWGTPRLSATLAAAFFVFSVGGIAIALWDRKYNNKLNKMKAEADSIRDLADKVNRPIDMPKAH